MKTLDRGLRLLELLAAAPGGLTTNELVTNLHTNRAIVYRLLKTLTDHRLVSRDEAGRYRVGTGLLALASNVAPRLQEVAGPHLARLAEVLEATAYLVIRDSDEAVVAMTAEPADRSSLYVSYRVGTRHSLALGAGGAAILAALPPRAGERDEVREARERGYASTLGDITPGLHGIAVGIPEGRRTNAAVGAVTFGEFDVDKAEKKIFTTARAISAALEDTL